VSGGHSLGSPSTCGRGADGVGNKQQRVHPPCRQQWSTSPACPTGPEARERLLTFPLPLRRPQRPLAYACGVTSCAVACAICCCFDHCRCCCAWSRLALSQATPRHPHHSMHASSSPACVMITTRTQTSRKASTTHTRTRKTSTTHTRTRKTSTTHTRAPRTDQRWRHVFTQLQPDAGCLGAKPQPNAGKGPSDVHRSMRRRDVRLGLLHTAVGLCHRSRLWVRGCHVLTPPSQGGVHGAWGRSGAGGPANASVLLIQAVAGDSCRGNG